MADLKFYLKCKIVVCMFSSHNILFLPFFTIKMSLYQMQLFIDLQSFLSGAAQHLM